MQHKHDNHYLSSLFSRLHNLTSLLYYGNTLDPQFYTRTLSVYILHYLTVHLVIMIQRRWDQNIYEFRFGRWLNWLPIIRFSFLPPEIDVYFQMFSSSILTSLHSINWLFNINCDFFYTFIYSVISYTVDATYQGSDRIV